MRYPARSTSIANATKSSGSRGTSGDAPPPPTLLMPPPGSPLAATPEATLAHFADPTLAPASEPSFQDKPRQASAP
ncbi:hypothetical protein K466DRAFT_597114 [Polyporus arcularius HHB13444]|uniref:Uncharacterized protein n=1 Tax=Polyporus arcularius HHB13444 TaxID=1314778 RepID=A0A5C3PW27_9APHY|nr:hypothetical protein K466DRAFT_597114 [Polyporus arcularius HHB13444]